jgi:hypothetical protein
MRDHKYVRARGAGSLAISLAMLVLAAGCGDKSGGSGGSGIVHDPKASGATTTPVTQKTSPKLSEGTLVISVLAGSGAAPPVAQMDGVIYTSDQGWYFFFVHTAGQNGPSAPQTASVPANAYWGVYQPTGGLPNGTRATAVITTSSGGEVAVICNETNATSFMSCNGQSP